MHVIVFAAIAAIVIYVYLNHQKSTPQATDGSDSLPLHFDQSPGSGREFVFIAKGK